MRRLALLLLMIMSMGIGAFAQSILDNIQLSNGEYVTKDYIFLEGENFELTADKPVKWKFFVLREKGSLYGTDEELVKESESQQESFSIEIDEIDWSNAHRIWSDTDDSVYFEGLVVIQEWDLPKEYLYLKFNLLPSVPKIMSINLDYTYNWEYGDFDDGLFEVGVTSDRATEYALHAHTLTCQYEYPQDWTAFHTVDMLCFETQQTVPIQLKNEFAQWGQYHKVIAANKYGAVYLPYVLNTLDYVKDPIILADIEKDRPVTQLSGSTRFSDIKFHMMGNKLYVDIADDKIIPKVSIYSLTGNKLIEEKDVEIDLSSLAKGYYIVRCVSDSNNIVTSKIYKP